MVAMTLSPAHASVAEELVIAMSASWVFLKTKVPTKNKEEVLDGD